MRTRYSQENLSRTVEAIYDCALEVDNWTLVLENIRADFNLSSAQLFTTPLTGRCTNIKYAGADPVWLNRLVDYGSHAIALWGGARRISGYPMDTPVAHSHLFDKTTMYANRFYREWAKPQGIGDCIGVLIASEDGLIHALSLGRGERQGDLRCDEEEDLRLLSPHFGRASRISALLHRTSIIASGFAETLDALSVCVALVDENLGLVHANLAAEALFRSSRAIGLKHGRLSMADTRAQDRLGALNAQAIRGEQALGRAEIELAISSPDGAAHVIHLLPLARGDLRRDIRSRATAALFITPAADDSRIPTAALSVLYTLTPAETRVLELVVEGHTVKDISRRLSVAESTIKTHLLRIFDKTGTRRQVDLLHLASTLKLPIIGPRRPIALPLDRPRGRKLNS